MPVNFFQYIEHEKQSSGEPLADYIGKDMLESFNPDATKYLCLDQSLTANYFIGMRWIEWVKDGKKDKGVIWVKPKNKNIPFERLLWKCLNHPVVSNHLSDCYAIFPDEPSIPLQEQDSDFITPLLIIDFLVRVNKIARKGLRKSFISHSTILHSRVKGKINIKETIKHQLNKNTITQNHCSFQLHTTNCIENQILKAALIQSKKYIYRYMRDRSNIIELLNTSLFTFDEVETKTITAVDFNNITHSAFYKEYKPALKLANLILKGLGFSVNSDISIKDKTVPPHYINMPELFERYCEVLLREKYPDTLAGYQYTGFSETRLGKSKQRPDFIIPSENMIADSKYKYWIEGSSDIEGMKQLSLYARHTTALKKLDQNNKLPVLQILYPSETGINSIDFKNEKNVSEKEYIDIYKLPINIH